MSSEWSKVCCPQLGTGVNTNDQPMCCCSGVAASTHLACCLHMRVVAGNGADRCGEGMDVGNVGAAAAGSATRWVPRSGSGRLASLTTKLPPLSGWAAVGVTIVAKGIGPG